MSSKVLEAGARAPEGLDYASPKSPRIILNVDLLSHGEPAADVLPERDVLLAGLDLRIALQGLNQ